jgi:hypothetical protein
VTFEEWHLKNHYEVFADQKDYHRVVWNAAQDAMRERCANVCAIHMNTVPKYDSPELNGFRRAYELASKSIMDLEIQ